MAPNKKIPLLDIPLVWICSDRPLDDDCPPSLLVFTPRSVVFGVGKSNSVIGRLKIKDLSLAFTVKLIFDALNFSFGFFSGDLNFILIVGIVFEPSE